MELSNTASKLDVPVPWFAAIAEPHGLGILARFSIRRVTERNKRLTQRLYEALSARNLLTHAFPKAARSPIVSLRLTNPDRLMARLARARVAAGLRFGLLCLSLHFYNIEAEIDQVVDLISDHDRRTRI